MKKIRKENNLSQKIENIATEMGVKNVKIVHSRAEDAGKNSNFREKYDFATARAVAALPVLSEYCLPFVKVGGIFISMKGPNENALDSESAVNILGGGICEIHSYSLENDSRNIIEIKKISQTPTKYPRNSSQIKKKSL